MSDIQVVLVEDIEQTRVGLRIALRAQDGIEVASEATNGITGLVLLESIDADVAIVDSSLPDMNLPEFVKQARVMQADSYVTQSKLLVLLDIEQKDTWHEALSSGAESYCLKIAPIAQLAEAVRRTHAGELYRDPTISLSEIPEYAEAVANLSLGRVQGFCI
ncbi:response regulator transcription factor [Tumidithrix helvetica PCC 7403]|uniref:response regulator n=1 Tax=Tumidithrix helvetica TaxID=3457545 RepID=UPI003C7FF381